MSAVSVLIARRTNLEADLRAALVAGRSTEKVREQIADVTARIDAHQRAEREVAEIAASVTQAKIRADAIKTAAAIEVEHQAILLSLEYENETPVPSNPAILAAAADLARATSDSDKATAQLQEAQAFATGIRERTEALTDARAVIVARRQAGTNRTTDAGDLELISADQEGLVPIIAEATSRFSAAKKVADEFAAARAYAAKHLAQAEAGAVLDALIERAQELDVLLLDVLGRITTAEHQTNRRKDYIGSRELRQALTMRAGSRNDLTRAELPGYRFPTLAHAR